MNAGRDHISIKKDWNTPPKYADAIYSFFDGSIDLDPCSNKNSFIKSNISFILPTDGLKEIWDYKNIYVNPPYGKYGQASIYDWIEKSYNSYKNFNSEVLLLIPVATNTSHFKDIIFKFAMGICFLNDTRLKFWSNGEEIKKGAPMACCFVYFGDNYNKFYNIFNYFGKCFEIS